jgi:hypothetical protein
MNQEDQQRWVPKAIQRARSLEQALADLNTKYQGRPSAELARMIRQLEVEIANRNVSRARRDTC